MSLGIGRIAILSIVFMPRPFWLAQDSGKTIKSLGCQFWPSSPCPVYDPGGDGVRHPHGKPDRVTFRAVPDDSYPAGPLMVRR